MNKLKKYRPITLVNKVLIAVLCKWSGQREEQKGSRVDKRAEDNMFVVSEMIVKRRKEGGKLYLGFLNLEKAYDRVDREMLGKVLGKIELSAKITNIVRSMLTLEPNTD